VASRVACATLLDIKEVKAMNPINQIIQGDCVQVLKSLSSNSVDLVVTDPPYLVNYRDRSGRTVKNDSGTGSSQNLP
jgi:DNA modification methylase